MVTLNNKRRERDVMKLMMSNYEVALAEDGKQNDFYVMFRGPKESPYENGTWKVHVLLPDSYPYKSPSIGFDNKVFHPNIDEASGTVCLDVINQTWSPMYDLINIFEVFLPQLLLYPNPTDPLNGDAANMLLKDPEKYKERVRDYVSKYATYKKGKFVEEKKIKEDKILEQKNNTNPKDKIMEKNSEHNSQKNSEEDYSILSNASDVDNDNE